MKNIMPSASLRISAMLLLLGQLLFIGITLLHPGGDANNHSEIFATYSASETWAIVHVGQFAAMAIMGVGLFALFFALDGRDATVQWTGRFGAALAVAAIGLYGVLQAVDGVALKHAVDALASAPSEEKAARFATAETIRWLEWGARSYQNVALGLALILLSVAAVRTTWIPRPVGILMGVSALPYLVQGWFVGVTGFTNIVSFAIMAAYVLDLIWMVWLVVAAWQVKDVEPLRSTRVGA